LPTFLCRPAFVVGIPVAFAILRFALVIPSARFQLNESPGILKEVFLDNLANCGIMEVPTTLNIFRSPLSAGGSVSYCPLQKLV
jgi:hypothetical protein